MTGLNRRGRIAMTVLGALCYVLQDMINQEDEVV